MKSKLITPYAIKEQPSLVAISVALAFIHRERERVCILGVFEPSVSDLDIVVVMLGTRLMSA